MRLSIRGHRAGPFPALGALALSGAAVALAGCAVAPAPRTGADSHAASPVATSASPGPGVSVARSTARPTPRQRAEADATAIFAAFAVPPGAQRLASAPSAGGGVLKRVTERLGTPDLVGKTGWWIAPGTPQQTLAWETAHLPHRFSDSGTSRSSGRGAATVLGATFSLPAVAGVLDSRELLVSVVADGKKTGIRVDSQVTWTPARPANEKVPAAAKAVTISESIGLNQGKAKPPRPVTITDPATVGRLAALIDGLPLTPPGVFSCPAAFGDALTLIFRAKPGAPALAGATAELSGCPMVDFTLGGKKQPRLAGTSGQAILKIAGLPWKIPAV